MIWAIRMVTGLQHLLGVPLGPSAAAPAAAAASSLGSTVNQTDDTFNFSDTDNGNENQVQIVITSEDSTGGVFSSSLQELRCDHSHVFPHFESVLASSSHDDMKILTLRVLTVAGVTM